MPPDHWRINLMRCLPTTPKPTSLSPRGTASPRIAEGIDRLTCVKLIRHSQTAGTHHCTACQAADSGRHRVYRIRSEKPQLASSLPNLLSSMAKDSVGSPAVRAAVIGAVFTLIGAIIGGLSTFGLTFVSQREQNIRDTAALARDQKREAYVAWLKAAGGLAEGQVGIPDAWGGEYSACIWKKPISDSECLGYMRSYIASRQYLTSAMLGLQIYGSTDAVQVAGSYDRLLDSYRMSGVDPNGQRATSYRTHLNQLNSQFVHAACRELAAVPRGDC